MIKLLLCASACAMVAACATDPTQSTEVASDKEYRTGSNIPARTREGVLVISPEDFERQRSAASASTIKRGN